MVQDHGRDTKKGSGVVFLIRAENDSRPLFLLVRPSHAPDVVFDGPDVGDAGAKCRQQLGIAHEPPKRRGQIVRVACADQQAVPPVVDDLRNAADPRRDHRHAGQERLVDDERTVLRPDRRHGEDVDRLQRLRDLLVRNRAVHVNGFMAE